MEEKEFNQRQATINELVKNTAPLKANLKKEISQYLLSSLDTIIKMSSERDEAFIKYMNLLKEFNFTNEITTPSDIFPGIKTISDDYSPEDLNKKTQEMKDYADTINTLSKNLDILTTNALTALRNAIKNLADLSIEENQIYDYCLDTIQDLDSIYDIGQIARATK